MTNDDYRQILAWAKILEKIHEDPGNGVEPDKMMFLYRLEDLKYDIQHGK